MHAPAEHFFDHVCESAVVEYYADRSKRVVYGNVPLGRKLQTRGPRCPEDSHHFVLDEYEGIRHTYIDKVCTKCTRRIPVK
jgi:hypothetical protein